MIPTSPRRASSALATLLAGAGFLCATGAAAQDTIPPADTTGIRSMAADSARLQELPTQDTLTAGEEGVVRALPPIPGTRPDRDPALVARWDRDLLLRTRALTLMELLSELPGAVPLRLGDWGGPEGLVMNGRAAGRLRVFVDGVEEAPLDGSTPDLALMTLSGIAEVEVHRAAGETVVLMTTLQATLPDPESLVEAGTGEGGTNIFRGTFLHPSAFGGALGLTFERLDSEGRGREQNGSLQSLWLRYLRPLGSRITVSGELRRRFAGSILTDVPPERSRLTRSLRLRALLADGVVAELFASQTSVDLLSDTLTFPRGAGLPDSIPNPGLGESRTVQYGARAGWAFRGVWGNASARYLEHEFRGTQLRSDVQGGITLPLVGVSGRFAWDRFAADESETLASWGVSAWTEPLLGFSFYGSLDDGDRGWLPPAALLLRRQADSVLTALPTGSSGTFLRAGARFSWGRISLDGAFLRTEVDSVLPLGTRVDNGARAFGGDEVTGFQVSGSLGVPRVPGLSVVGSLQQWESEGLYRPGRIYRGGLAFHDTFYPTGNLEITANAVVEGRDPMPVPILDETGTTFLRVPFYQSWNFDLQIRVVTVRLFIRWDNLTIRDTNQDLPGFDLPRTRTMYGVRWILRN